MTWTSGGQRKRTLIENLIRGFCKFFHEGGANLVPADTQYYSKTGLPDADRALLDAGDTTL